MNVKECPCGSGKIYEKCCGIVHTNINSVNTAEQLMRSRYSAFCMANGEYLHKSHHTKTRPKSKLERNETVNWAKSVTWLKLEIINTTKGSKTDDTGTVEFKAFYMENGSSTFMHEISTFNKTDGHWVYFDGINMQ